MATADIINFKSPDLVNLQGWLKKAPKEFNRAATNVTNTVARDARLFAIKNIEKNTNTRNKSFVSKSMRFDKAKHGRPLNQIIAVMGSIDISRQGRSTGFEELETGRKQVNPRVPTLASRGGTEKRPAARAVRMDKIGKMFRPRMVRGAGAKTKRQRVAAMLRVVKSGAIGRQPFIFPRGIKSGKMAAMRPGVYRLGNDKQLQLANPFQENVRRNTKRISWMAKAVRKATTEAHLKTVWNKEVDFVLRKRR